MNALLDLDFERLIVAHWNPIEIGAKSVVQSALDDWHRSLFLLTIKSGRVGLSRAAGAEKNLLLLGPSPGGQSWLHIESRKASLSSHSLALDFLAGRRPILIERTLGERRSGRRFFQKGWTVNF
jgi:hypothetical protein